MGGYPARVSAPFAIRRDDLTGDAVGALLREHLGDVVQHTNTDSGFLLELREVVGDLVPRRLGGRVDVRHRPRHRVVVEAAGGQDRPIAGGLDPSAIGLLDVDDDEHYDGEPAPRAAGRGRAPGDR